MSESQSRYGIMESLNQKKLEAGNKIAQIEKELKQQEMKFNNYKTQCKQQIETENSSYKEQHELWKENQKIAIQMKQMEHQQMKEKFNREINDMQRAIIKSDETYEEEHIKRIAGMEAEKEKNTKAYDDFLELKELDKKAILQEITELDNAIKSLKEISSEQAKGVK